MWLTQARPHGCWLLLLPLLLLPTGTRLAPDTGGLGPFTELEKADAAGLFLAYGQLAM